MASTKGDSRRIKGKMTRASSCCLSRGEVVTTLVSILTSGSCSHILELFNVSTDNGAGQLIIDGKIKLKNDSKIKRFQEHAIEFEDGSTLAADVAILATG